MSLSSISVREDCVYRLSFESGADIELYEYIGPPKNRKYLRISQQDVELPVFDRLVEHSTRYVNSRGQRISLEGPAAVRMNPRYKCSDVRPHLVVIACDADSAGVILQPSKHLMLCCQVVASDGQILSISNAERCDVPLGAITQSIEIAKSSASLPRRL